MIKNDLPLVSVIVPVYNHKEYVQRCLNSIVDQSYENIEIIVIDDGSTDNSIEAINEIKDKLINRFVNTKIIRRENYGICITANQGIKLSNGKYHLFVSSDDALLSDNVKLQVDYLEKNPQYICSFTDGYEINSEDMERGDFSNAVKFSDKLEFKEGNLRSFMLKNVFNIPSPAFIYNRERLVNEVGFYDEDLKIEDIDMFLRISQKCKIGNVKKVLYLHRIHRKNSGKNYELIANELNSLIEKYSKRIEYNKNEMQLLIDNLREKIKVSDCLNVKMNFIREQKFYPYINSRRIVVWGTGSYSLKIVDNLDIGNIAFFISSSINQKEFLGRKIFKPEYLNNKQKDYYVIIASSYFDEISQMLEEKGYNYMKDFY